MKRILALLLALTLAFVFVACSNEKDTTSEPDTSTTQTENASTDTNDTQTSETDSDESSSDTETPSNSTPTTNTETSKPTTNDKDNTTSSKPSDTTSKPTTSNPTEISTSKHTHNYSAATCTTPRKCSCGATDGSALGHKWIGATCKVPKTCGVCNIKEGNVSEHVIENGLCKFCKETIVVLPENLDVTKTYVHISEIDDFELENVYYRDIIKVDTIFFSENSHIGERGLFSSNQYDYTEHDTKISYEGKEYYYFLGGVGIGITYEFIEQQIIIRDESEPTEYAILNLLSDGSLKIVSKTDKFKGNWETQVGWIYKPTTYNFFNET